MAGINQSLDDSDSVHMHVKPPLLRVRLDTLTSVISDTDTSEDEENGVGPLDANALSKIRRGSESDVLLWLQLLEDEEIQPCVHSGDRQATINHAIQISVKVNRPKVTELLLDHGASIGVRDDEKRTLLHLINGCPPEDNISDMMNMLILRGCNVNAKDEDKNTPLHYAAENGHILSVRILLDAGAKLSAKNDDNDTPMHTASANGHLQVIDELIKRNPNCIHFRGFQNETPLHDACAAGSVKVARRLIEKGAVISSMSDIGETPLHKAAETSSMAVVKLLLDEGAEVNPKTCAKRTPLAKACNFGQLELVNLLLERGAEVNPNSLEDALKEGYESVVQTLISHFQWPKAMRHTYEYEGKVTTPFRHMIRTMPEVAEAILGKCTLSPPNCPDPEEPYYSVLFNYEFVEDFQNECGDEKQSGKKSKFEEKPTHGCGYMDVRKAKKESFTTTWGPVSFTKENHPLWIMAQHKRLHLLTHPLVGSLLHYKWKTFAQTVYLINLVSYFLFVAFITSLAMIMPNPQSNICTNQTSPVSVIEPVTDSPGFAGTTCGNQMSVFAIAIAVILTSTFRLLLEIPQMFVLKHRYLLEFSNWMEITLFVSSIVFACVFSSPCFCPKSWQWQIGTVAVFLAWIDLMLFLDKFPWIGIYVLMFVQVVSTFVKTLFVSCLLVIAFALTLYMNFYEPSIKRSPFSTAGRAIVKTVSMCTGELEFDSIFHQEPSGERDDMSDVPFAPVSYLLWIAFIVFIPILLINMLVGLAVGDIQSIYDEAKLKKLSLQVELVLTFEELLPTKLRRLFVTGRKEIYPNKKPSFMKQIQDFFWAGEPYDTRSSIRLAVRPKDTNKEIQKKTNVLIHDVDDVKHGLLQLQDQNKESQQKLMIVMKKITEINHSVLNDNIIATCDELAHEMKEIKKVLRQSEEDIEDVQILLQNLQDQ